MTVTETCCCGAKITASDSWSPYVMSEVKAFREQHKGCLALALPGDPPAPSDAE